MSLYKDINDKLLDKQDKLLIQIDSIIKLDYTKWKDSITYLDEFSCLLSYILTSTTLKSKRIRVFNNLYQILRHSSHILCTDADINDMVLYYFDKIGLKYHLIENIYKNVKDINAYQYNEKEILIRQMEQTLLDGENIISCFDSKREMDIIVERLRNFCKRHKLFNQLEKFLVYSSTEGDDNDFLIIDDKWIDRNVFYTPRLLLGVSFYNVIPRKVFLLALCVSINVFGFIQQISRCRNISELHYYVAKRYRSLRYECVDDVKKYYKKMLQDYNNLHLTNKYIHLHDDPLETSEIDIYRTDYDKIKELVEIGAVHLDYLTGEWDVHETIFNDMFFINEYYDHIMRTAPREHFRWMLEDKGYQIIENDDTVDNDEKKIIINKNKIIKKHIVDRNDETYYNALHNKVNKLTDNEKNIHDDAVRRAKYLNIDFNKKVQKRKWNKYLINEKDFTKHIAYKLLTGSEDNLDLKIAVRLDEDYKISICNNLEEKIKLIKQVEKILNVDTLDIDTKRDIDRFDEKVDISDDLLNMLIKAFRIRKSKETIAETYGSLYNQLVMLYRNVLGNEIINVKVTRINNVQYRTHTTNQKVIDEHNALSNL